MDRATAYATLAGELECWRHLPFDDLASLVGDPPAVKSVIVGGEVIDVEVVVRWAGAKRIAVRVEAVANGPSCWRLDRLEESIIIPASRPPGATAVKGVRSRY